MPKKIGILTYFGDSTNPGTFLQAYSMQEALRTRFPNDRVELVGYKRRRNYFLPTRSHVTVGQIVRDFRKYRIYRQLFKQCLITNNDSLITQDSQRAWAFIENQQYDLIVVGSDTILELAPLHFRNGTVPVYWLPPSLACKKVMCAASAGALEYEKLGEKHQKALRKSVNGFDLLGVRDDATFNLVKAAGLKDESKLKMVPDPTVSYDIDYNPIERVVRERNLDLSMPTVLLHLPRLFKLAAELAAYYTSKNFQVLSLIPAKYADLCLTDISPFEFAGIFRGLDLVITGFFHGTMFALKNTTPVISIVTTGQLINKNGLSKYYSLLRYFGLDRDNLVDGVGLDNAQKIIETADKVMSGFDRGLVKEKLGQLRATFNTFLDKIAALLAETRSGNAIAVQRNWGLDEVV